MDALAGLTVVDLTHYVAGPYCTKLLTDYGAEVLKIEQPGVGDRSRQLGPFRGDARGEEPGGIYVYLNAGKRGLTLDLRTAPGADLLRRLVARADVLVESFRPGTMERWGLGYEELARVNPRVVMCSISSFGQSGLYRDYVPSEIVLQAMGGLVYLTGDPGREPLHIPMPLTQYIAGLQAYVALLAAVFAARSNGQGDKLDVSILEALLSLQDTALANEDQSGSVGRRYGHRHSVQYPAGAFACRDGFVFAFAVLPEEWRALTEVIGRPELGDDPRYRTPSGRRAHADELDAVLAPWIEQRRAREIYDAMQQRRVSFGMVATARDLLESPHLNQRDSFDKIIYGAHTLRVPGPPFRMTGATRAPSRRAPALGEANDEVYRGRLGLSSDDIATLQRAGAV